MTAAGRGRAGVTLTELLVALALVAAVAAVAAGSQLQQRLWLQRAAAQATVLRLVRAQLEVVRIDPAPGPCWSLTASERATGYRCRVASAACPLGAAACAPLLALGVPALRVTASGPHGARAEVVAVSAAPLLPTVLEGR